MVPLTGGLILLISLGLILSTVSNLMISISGVLLPCLQISVPDPGGYTLSAFPSQAPASWEMSGTRHAHVASLGFAEDTDL